MTLTEQITARLDEWEAVARAPLEVDWDDDDALEQNELSNAQPHSSRCGWRLGEGLAATCSCDYPAAVLGLAAGLRVAVALHEPREHGGQLTERWCPSCTVFEPCSTLLALAAALGLDAGGAE